MDRILAKNNNRMKSLEERLHDAEDQAIQASRRVRLSRFSIVGSLRFVRQVAKQLVRDRLAITPGDHHSYSSSR